MNNFKIALGAVGVTIALAACAAPAPQQEAPAAAPAAPAERTIEVAADPVFDAFETSWNSMSSADQSDMCWFAYEYPAEAWAAFDEGQQGLVDRSTFEGFIDTVC